MVSLLEYSVLVPGDVCQVRVGSGVAKLREEGQQVQTISEVTGVGGGERTKTSGDVLKRTNAWCPGSVLAKNDCWSSRPRSPEQHIHTHPRLKLGGRLLK